MTLIDRSMILPAPDAASSDINKIVRSDYAGVQYRRFKRVQEAHVDLLDPFWAAMAKEAIIELRKPEWEGLYHQ